MVMQKSVPEHEPGIRHGTLPVRLVEYAQQHPEILPDYRPFAHDIIDLVERLEQHEIVALIGPHGIGKSSLLAPALFETGKARGYTKTLSIGGIDTPHGYELHLDPHLWYKDKQQGPRGLSPEEIQSVAFSGQERSGISRFKDAIARRFRENPGSGVCFFDELYGIAECYPELTRSVAEMAAENDVTIVTTTPLVDPYGAGEATRERIEWETGYILQHQAERLNGTMVRVEIVEQRIPLSAIPDFLETYDVDPAGIRVFERNPALRRLQVFDRLVVQILGILRHDNPSLGTVTMQELGNLLNPNIELDQAIQIAGLTPEGYAKMILDMRR